MPYKIYTYADPYRISHTDFWDDIKDYPHLCASRTLARGLIQVIEEENIEGLICPIDDIVDKRVFWDWSKNIRRKIKQSNRISSFYRQWHDLSDKRNALGDKQFEALIHNKGQMLDSVRLFIELGISSDSIDVSELNKEQKIFHFLLSKFEKETLFTLPLMPSLPELKNILIKQAENELKEKVKLLNDREYQDSDNHQKELSIFNKMIKSTQKWDGSHIIVHGIHQFTPLQLRLITHMEKLGVEIIFLHNYLDQFKEIYSSWDYIYQQFDAPVHHDENIKIYNPGYQFQRTGNAIATNIALLCEESSTRNDPRIIKNYEFYKDETIKPFDNISEYAGYVSDLFTDAEKKLFEERPVREKLIGVRPSTAKVLARMDDVIYTANKEVDELLQVYHPEYARNRHFLAYPIGQFFVALYELWNVERREIDIDYNLLRECINSGVLNKDNMGRVLDTMMNLEPLFKHVTTYSDFQNEFVKYQECYKKVNSSIKGSVAFQLKALNLYNSHKVTEKDIKNLFDAITEINLIASKFFKDVDQYNLFQFDKHFKRLKEFINEKRPTLVNEEEQELIDKLLVRLEVIETQMESNDTGSIEDLRDGLYYYLKQKETPVSDWFVRNFEQIDGDVLLSKSQNSPGREKVYHFACVSDKDMNRTVNELFPWPLSEQFFEKAYVPKELPFQVYYASLCEHSNFLRYALFYGLYFSQCTTKISYVKRYGNDTTDYYEMLRLIGMKEECMEDRNDDKYNSFITIPRFKKIASMKYDRNQMGAMMLCPYRFFLDYVVNPDPIYSGDFLLQKYYMNLIIENTWKALQKMNAKTAKKQFPVILNQQVTMIDCFFPFFSESEKIDIKRQAENYIKASSNLFNGTYEYNQSHMDLRSVFIKAKFFDDLQDSPSEHKYAAFEKLAAIEQGQKTHSLHNVPKIENKQLISCTIQYLNESKENGELVGSWCLYCPDRNICHESYAEKRE